MLLFLQNFARKLSFFSVKKNQKFFPLVINFLQKIFFSDLFFAIAVFFLIFPLAVKISGRDFWYDEAFSGLLVREDSRSFWVKIFYDVHPPLFYVLLKTWGKIFGFCAENLRGFSLLCHGISIFLFLKIAKNFFDQISSRILSLAFAVSPFFLGYGTEVRMYALFGTLIFAATFFLLRGINFCQQENRGNLVFTGDFFWFSFFLGLAFWTHYFAAIAAICFFIFLFLEFKEKIHKQPEKNFLTFVTIFFPAAVFFFLWFPIFILQYFDSPGIDWIPNISWYNFPEILTRFFFGINLGQLMVPQVPNFIFFPSPEIFFTFFIFLLGANWKKLKENQFLFGVLFGILPIFIGILISKFWRPIFVERYFLPFGAFLFLFIFQLIKETFGKNIFRFFVGVQILISILFFSYGISISKNFLALKKTIPFFQNSTLVFDNFNDFAVARFYFTENNIQFINSENPRKNVFSHFWDKNKNLEIKAEKLIFFFSEKQKNDNFYQIGKIEKFEIYKLKNEQE